MTVTRTAAPPLGARARRAAAPAVGPRLGRGVAFALVWIAPPPLKKVLLRWLCDADVDPSAHIGWFSAVAARRVVLGRHSVVRPLSLIRCTQEVRLGDYAEVSSFVLAYGAGSLSLGRHAYIGPQSLINADEPVRIGDMSALGPRAMVFTHGSFLPATEGYPVRLAGVGIGDRTWVAAGVFVHPGVTIGDDAFVNARAVVTSDLPAGAVAEGNPARVVGTVGGFRRRMTPARVAAAMRQALARFADMVLRGELGLAVEARRDCLRFAYDGRAYRVQLLPGASPEVGPSIPGERAVLLDARAGGPAPAAGPETLVVRVSPMRTARPRDPVHAELVTFLRRYYGMHFEFDEEET